MRVDLVGSSNVSNVSANPSATKIALSDESGLWQATVSAQGAALLRLTRDGSELVTAPSTAAFNSFAGLTLAPWPNRLAAGSWQLGERKFQGTINEPARNTALHGLVFDRQFKVRHHFPSEVTFSLLLGTDAAYPFAVEVLVTYRLFATGLEVELGAINHDAGPAAPFGIGSHPYFVVEPDSTLALPAQSVIVTDPNLIPTGSAPADSCGVELQQTVPVEQLALDHCFTDLVAEADNRSRTRLSRPTLHGSTVVWQDKSFDHLMVFTLFGALSGQPNSPVAVEPQTCAANALQSGEGLIWLAPETPWSARWGVEFEEDAP